MSSENKALHIAICEYLEQLSRNPGHLDADSIQVALQCLTESLEINMDDCEEDTLAAQGTSLDEVFEAGLDFLCQGDETDDIFKKSQDDVTPNDKILAEQYKTEGNGLLSVDLEGALDKYTQAITLNPYHHIYWNNRAVVQYKLEDYKKCVEDAKNSIFCNENYSKSHYRLGLAFIELKKYNDASNALGKAKTVAVSNGETTMVSEIENALKNCNNLKSNNNAGNSNAGAGGAGGLSSLLGGLDFGALASNPMFQNMAENLQQNPGAAMQMLQNPEIMQAMQSMMGGQQPPQ